MQGVSRHRSRSIAELIVLLVVGAMVAYLAIAGWFRPFQFDTFAGDDLRLVDVIRTEGAMTPKLWALKFRPINALITSAIVTASGFKFAPIAAAGLMIHSANALLFFYILSRVLRMPLALSCGLAAIAFLNRFATYLFMQEQAIMEGAGVMALLLLLLVSLRYHEKPTLMRSVSLALLYAIIIHIHERFLVLAVPLGLLAFFAFRSARQSAVLLFAGTAAGAVFNLAIKKFWIQTPILVGTTTAPIEFNVQEIAGFLWTGALNIAGINAGPAHLSLGDFGDAQLWVQVLSVIAALVSCFLLVAPVVEQLKNRGAGERSRDLSWLLFGLAAIAVLLLSASITFRQEYRWIYPAYLVLLALFGFGLQRAQQTARAQQWALTCLILVTIPKEWELARHHERFYAFDAYRIATNLHATARRDEQLASAERIVVQGPLGAASWIFMDDAFSRFYHLPPLEFEHESTASEATDGAKLALLFRPESRSFIIAAARQQVSARSRPASYAALERAAAQFHPSEAVATPTKTPLFRLSKNGVSCMVAVSAVEVTVPVPRDATTLHVSFSHFYAIGDGASVMITSDGPAGSQPLLARVVPALPADDAPVWRKYEFPLPAGTAEVRVKVFSESDPSADWLAFRDFSFE